MQSWSDFGRLKTLMANIYQMKVFKIGQVPDWQQFLTRSAKSVWWTLVH